jgi:hypothetical protein
MRQYLIDEIRRDDLERLRDYLKEHALPSSLEDLWWVEIPEDLLSPEQFSYPELKPFCFAIELGRDFVRFELLIRSRQSLHHPAIAYATRPQRDFILAFADRLVEDLDLKT